MSLTRAFETLQLEDAKELGMKRGKMVIVQLRTSNTPLHVFVAHRKGKENSRDDRITKYGMYRISMMEPRIVRKICLNKDFGIERTRDNTESLSENGSECGELIEIFLHDLCRHYYGGKFRNHLEME
ncbi:hypothetical protein ACP275_01G043800 [Erythranthe tilingii]